MTTKERDKPHVIIYTDGACSGNPGPGGWGALLHHNGKEKVISGAEHDSTNNRMEMRAIIEALKSLKKACHVSIHSDSALIINAFTKRWVEGWIHRGWKKADKKPVENRDLWEELIGAMQRYDHDIKWIKVKGHSGDRYNEQVDRLAVEARKKLQKKR